MKPAALRALLDGDFSNYLAATTPGGIERQEAEGQALFVAAELIPKDLHGTTREALEALGFTYRNGSEDDEIFNHCMLPSGWCKRSTDHPMWSDLLDSTGTKRASIFYKAAFYDRSAFLQWEAST